MAKALAIVQGPAGRACLFEKDRVVGFHAHSGPHIIFKQSGADFAYEVAGQGVAPCTRETIVLVNAMQSHGNHSLGRLPSVILSLYLSPDWLAGNFPLFQFGAVFRRPSVPVTPRLRVLGDLLEQEMRANRVLAENRAESILGEIALEVLTTYSDAGVHALVARNSDRRIRRAIAHLRDNLTDKPDFAAVASRMGLSRSRFFELFQGVTGLPPKGYVDMLRMEASVQRLTFTDFSIREVGAASGFPEQSHFSRFFAQQVGVTPAQYRRATCR